MKCYKEVLILMCVVLFSCAKDFHDKLDRFLIACHSTDFTCFKKQYQSLRDHFLLGNRRLGVEEFEPYYFKYGESGTCIKLSGLEESRLAAVSLDSNFYTVVLEMPLKIQQVENDTMSCYVPARDFPFIGKETGPLKSFTGNATMQIIFPYELRKKKGQIHMILGEEGMDVILDIPDLSDLQTGTMEEIEEYELSEWAYELIQHVDAAQDFALPYSSRFHAFAERIPLQKYLLLYPEEEYTDIQFTYNESPFYNFTSPNEQFLSTTEK